jgi:hypothetical protein
VAENVKKNESVDLGDGRRVQVIAYQDGSIRFYIHGVQGPYAIAEAWLPFNPGHADPIKGGKATLKVVPLP